MAGRPANNKNNETVKTEKVASTIDNELLQKENENNELKKQLLEMQEMIKKLTAQQESVQSKEKNNTSKTAIIESEEYPEIPTSKPIRVMSLFNGGLNLKTSSDSSAQVFRFEKVGDILPIIYLDLSKIISNQRRFFEEGFCIVMDKDVVKLHYLEDAMKKVLDHKTITNILDYDIETIKQLVKNTTQTIQQTIADLLIEKINKNEYLDRNKVSIISEIYGHDIYELAGRVK